MKHTWSVLTWVLAFRWKLTFIYLQNLHNITLTSPENPFQMQRNIWITGQENSQTQHFVSRELLFRNRIPCLALKGDSEVFFDESKMVKGKPLQGYFWLSSCSSEPKKYCIWSESFVLLAQSLTKHFVYILLLIQCIIAYMQNVRRNICNNHMQSWTVILHWEVSVSLTHCWKMPCSQARYHH